MDEFTSRVLLGQSPSATPTEIEALIDWIASHHAQNSKTLKLNDQKIPIEVACKLGVVYLDHNLLALDGDPYRMFGLAPDADESEIRARYRRLLQIFHPDRHPDDQAWFTDCTGKINRAYTIIKSGKHSRVSTIDQPFTNSRSPQQARAQHTGDNERTHEPEFSREAEIRSKIQSAFGSSRKLKVKIFAAFILVPMVVIALAYLQNKGISDPNTAYRNALPPTPALKKKAKNTLLTKKPVTSGDEEKGLTHTERALLRLTPVKENQPTIRQREQYDPSSILRTQEKESDNQQDQIKQRPGEQTEQVSVLVINPENAELSSSLSEEDKPRRIYSSPEAIPAESGRSSSGITGTSSKDPAPAVIQTHPAIGVDTIGRGGSPLPKKTERVEKIPRHSSESTTYAKMDRNESPEIRQSATVGDDTLAKLVANRKKVDAFLKEFQLAFSSADVPRLMVLFHESATSRNGARKSDIKRRYVNEFATNASQDLRFAEFKVRVSDRQGFHAEVNYMLVEERLFPKGFKQRTTGVFILSLVEVGSELKIWRMD